MNVNALAKHATCVQAAVKTLSPARGEGSQTFELHREAILGNVRLCMLVAHLYNRHWPCDLPGLLQNEDENTAELALELISEYQEFGEAMPDFMALGFEIATAISQACTPTTNTQPEVDEDDGYVFG